jgi:hypothetical protein
MLLARHSWVTGRRVALSRSVERRMEKGTTCMQVKRLVKSKTSSRCTFAPASSLGSIAFVGAAAPAPTLM